MTRTACVFYLPSLCLSREGYQFKLWFGLFPPEIVNVHLASSDLALTCAACKMGGAASARSVVIVNVYGID